MSHRFVLGCGLAAQGQSPAPNPPVTVLFSFFSEATSSQPISMIKAKGGTFYGATIGGEIDLGRSVKIRLLRKISDLQEPTFRSTQSCKLGR